MIDALGGEPAVTNTPNRVTGHDGVLLNREMLAKRRKVRKGTQSCWECKRRKIRCIFASSDDVTCLGCQRRRAACVSQLMPEELSPVRKGNRHLGERIARVKDFIEDLLASKDVDAISYAEGKPRQDRRPKFDTSTARSDDPEPSTIRAPPTHIEVRELPIHCMLFLIVS